jgi:uncharacterized RDD family membrane protein YckC
METIDQTLIQADQTAVKYAGFWPRFGASFLDSLLIGAVSMGISYFNIISWKSTPLLILISLLTIAYKPVLEYMHGATLGKMALDLKVVNTRFEAPSLGEILSRNAYQILFPLVLLVLTVNVYTDPDFEYVNGFMEYSSFTASFPSIQYVNYVQLFVVLVDGIVFLADKDNRSLHDKIGHTSVIALNR